MRARIGLAVALAASTALLCQGCISTDFRPSLDVTAAPLRPGPPSSVRVLPAPPTVPFSVLGEIEANVTGFYSDEAVLKRVLRVAAARGANAVVFARDAYRTVMRCTGPGEDCGPEQKRCSVVYLALRVPEPSEPQAAGPAVGVPGWLAAQAASGRFEPYDSGAGLRANRLVLSVP